jgi:septation ring formation regulator EzrA
VDRVDRKSDRIPASLETALNELQVSVERHIDELVRSAETRASEIEDRAARKARELEANAGRTTAAVNRATRAVDRATRMLEAIDSTQSSFAESLTSLRAESERLLETLEQGRATGPVRNHEARRFARDEPDKAIADLHFLDELDGR